MDDYKVVTASAAFEGEAARELAQCVKSELKEGWKLQGGASLSVTLIGSARLVTMIQAMTKEENGEL